MSGREDETGFDIEGLGIILGGGGDLYQLDAGNIVALIEANAQTSSGIGMVAWST